MEIGSDQRIVACIDWKMFKYLVIMLEERMNEERFGTITGCFFDVFWKR